MASADSDSILQTLPQNKQLKTFTRADVAQHKKEGDVWFIIDSVVYDVSKFVDMHPGGAHVLLDRDIAGKDATEAFFGLHRSEVLRKYGRYAIGTVEGEKPQVLLPKPGALSPVPHGEPGWLSEGFSSPYYTEGHRQWQAVCRKFFDENIRAEAQEHELTGKRPTQELCELMGRTNFNAARLGPGKHLHGLRILDCVDGKDFDYFHELILTQEIARMGARGYSDGMLGGMVIGLAPVLNFAKPELKKQVLEEVLSSKKYIALAISEAFAGSDVAGLKTTGVKTEDGKHYIVNGTKKWITNGTFADYFSTAVRTDKGLTMLLIPRIEGVETKAIKTSYSPAAGTAYVTFDNVKVPIENVLGKENKGIYVVLSNFNHERWIMACGAVRGIRFITTECFVWAHVRKVFGKPLISQPVIRQKLAAMFAKSEALQSWLEHITYQMTKMSYAEQADILAGQIAMLKAYTTRSAGEIADEAVQIFGGRGITQSGMGKFVEGYQRSYKFDSILGGSEEVLYDLGVRQAMRKMPKTAL